MWSLWLLAVVGLVLVTLLTRNAFRIYRKRESAWGDLDHEGVERGLRLLLKRGYDGAFAVLTDQPSGLFVQFRKYIRRPGECGIEMHFPRAPWSEPYYVGVQLVLRRNGVAFERIGLQIEPTTEVIRADFCQDVALAARVVTDIVVSVFHRPTISLHFKADDICPVDETVETFDHPRPVERQMR
jgi:hypothetical protein